MLAARAESVPGTAKSLDSSGFSRVEATAPPSNSASQAVRTTARWRRTQRVVRASHFAFELLEFGVRCGGQSECGLQFACVDRLREVGADAACDRPLDQTGVLDAGDDDDRPAQAFARQPFGGVQPVEVRHLD